MTVHELARIGVRTGRKVVEALSDGLDELEALIGDGRATDPLPTSPSASAWKMVGERENVTYPWPADAGGPDTFDRFRIYESPKGLKIALGFGVTLAGRRIVGVFKLGSGGGSPYPIVYFQGTDDFAQTRELIAPIRGRGGHRGKAMFKRSDGLPPLYDQFEIADLRARVEGHRFDVLGIVAREDDEITMVEHGAAQVDLRGL